jgi:amino acid transporter
VKEANKKLPMVVLVAGIVIILVYLAASSVSAFSVLNVGTQTVGGHQWSFFQGYSWLSYGPVDWAAAGVPANVIEQGTSAIWSYLNINFQPAWSTGIASIIARGMDLGWLSWIIALAGVFWLANDIPPFLLVASRTFFAMSFDRMMPERFSYVSEKWHSPVWAIVVTGIAAMLGAIAESGVAGLGTYFAFAGVVGTDVFDAAFLTLFCVSAMLLPLERKEIFDRAAVKHSIGTIVGLGALATLGAGFCLYIFIKESPWIFTILTPASAGDFYSGLGFFLCIGIGILLYIYYMYRNSTKGIDMRTLYITIPPE